ncbi:hypothetical protein ACFWDI_24485 [Streptomyces sp. NPDC060064]|uniref:hypothetical protein n=1 Tax=Streptomyces sp. NPDC060064 TaxID=3347049 RepID=UPI0036A4FABF
MTFGRAFAGLPTSGVALVPGSNRPLPFRGSPTVTVPPGGSAYSYPLPGAVRAQSDLAVSLYVQQTGRSRHRPQAGPADLVRRTRRRPLRGRCRHRVHRTHQLLVLSRRGRGPRPTRHRRRGHARRLDHRRLQVDGRHQPPLARLPGPRSPGRPRSRIKGVACEGISGNQVLSDGVGQSALARPGRDILAQRGLRTVVLLEGVNDIKATSAPTAADLIAAYRQITAGSHAAGRRWTSMRRWQTRRLRPGS